MCSQCRASKLRCDRVRPACGNCVKKGEAESCQYGRSVSGRSEFPRQNVAEDRLKHLEFLVKQLIQTEKAKTPQDSGQEPPATPDASPREETSSRAGDARTGRVGYVGSTHWFAVLDEIDGLKAELSKPSDQDVESLLPTDEQTQDPLPEPIFGSLQHYSLKQVILDYLPPRLEADRLLSIYFQGENFILPFLHTFHFQRQYVQFWSDLHKVNPLWLSITFSVFHMASLVRGCTAPTTATEGETRAERFRFHHAAGQCLVVGEYHRPQEFVVEALLAYAHCKSMSSLDPLRETGAILGMAVRSAYQLGYHRDPDRFKGFTVFEGEMRRRSWTLCVQLDLMTSFQLGLPSSICQENCDTRSVRNLSDSDFGPDSQELPPSRSEDQATRLLWFVAKDRQMKSFARVCRDALSHQEKSDLEIQELDREVREMWTTTPEVLRARPLSESIADPPFTIITRIYLQFIYLKSLCVLHRKYMIRGNPYSTMSCLEASKALVSQFVDMYRELAPGGRLYAENWMLGCYTMNDFLLGITVLCLFVHCQSGGSTQGSAIITNEVDDLLEQARSICLEKSNISNDARRVARVIRITLNMNRSVATASCRGHLAVPSNGAITASREATVGQSVIEASDDTMYWDEDPFSLLEPFSFMRDGTGDLDWSMLEPPILGDGA